MKSKLREIGRELYEFGQDIFGQDGEFLNCPFAALQVQVATTFNALPYVLLSDYDSKRGLDGSGANSSPDSTESEIENRIESWQIVGGLAAVAWDALTLGFAIAHARGYCSNFAEISSAIWAFKAKANLASLAGLGGYLLSRKADENLEKLAEEHASAVNS